MGARTPGQRWNPGAKRGIQPFNVSRVEDPDLGLGTTQHLLGYRPDTETQTPFYGQKSATGFVFDQLYQMHLGPEAQSRPTRLTGIEGVTTFLAHRFDPAAKIIS